NNSQVSGQTSNKLTLVSGTYKRGDAIKVEITPIDNNLLSGAPLTSDAVTIANTAPVAGNQSAATIEGLSVPISLSGSDVDMDTLTYAVVSSPAHGTLSGSGINRTYTPAAGWNGTDTFTYKANDGTADSNIATVTITVAYLNYAPVLAPIGPKTVNAGSTLTFTLSATDANIADTLAYTAEGTPLTAFGAIFNSNTRTFTWTPNNSQAGTHSVTFRVTDNGTPALSAAEAITITVNRINHAPVARPSNEVTDEDTPKTITLKADDSDNDALTYSLVTNPAHGSLSGALPNLIYTPAQDYNGSDSFTFKVNDGTVDSAPATVSIVIDPVNDAPVMTGAAIAPLSPKAGDTLTATGTATDVDSPPASLTYTYQWKKNGANINGATAQTFVVNNIAKGDQISVSITANDGQASSSAKDSNSLTLANTAPVASNSSVAADEDTLINIPLSATDADGDSLTYTIVTGPAHGTGSLNSSSLSYLPNKDYNGSDSFTFKVSDGTVDSAPATVSIVINPVNDAPVMTGAAIAPLSPKAGDTLTATGTATDVDSPPASLTYTYQWKKNGANINGATAQTFVVNNIAKGDQISVSITPHDESLAGLPMESSQVMLVNAAPVMVSASIDKTAPKIGETLTATGTGSDPDLGDVITYTYQWKKNNQDLGQTGKTLDLLTGNFTKGNSLSVVITPTDGLASGNPLESAAVTIANTAPVAGTISANTNEDAAVAITLSAGDADNDALTYAIVSSPAHGTLSGSGANRTYTPAAGWNGTDTFTYKANDGTDDSNIATVTITVAYLNYAPVLAPIGPKTVNAGSTLTFTLSATDANIADTLAYTAEGTPLTAFGAI
ncbi:MAG TPA: Ig-like domain-containing protein, partial [Candidatus Sulfotelmatobacter sp.]|nr:Ig-like domain-containing protein [Candidatus Sulfotelmatobacter sp.]